MDRRFVGGRRLAGFDIVGMGGETILSAYPRLRSGIERRCGPEAARFLAEPVLTSGNGTAPARVDWYCDRDGAISALDDLAPAEAHEVRRKAASLAREIAALCDDPEIGAIVAGAFNLAGSDALLCVGHEPVLVDWALVPTDVAGNEQSRHRHHEAALNAPLGLTLPLPPITEEEWAARFGRTQPMPFAPPSFPAVTAPVPAVRIAVAPWIALAAAAALLSLSFWPGVLRFAGDGDARAADRLAASVADGLRGRQAALAAAADLDCDRLGVELPRLVPQSPRAVMRVPGPAGAEPAVQFGPVPAAVSPALPQSGGQQPTPAPDDLAARLAAATVLVIAGEGSGSGFFIAPDLVVTNRHVVEGATQVTVAGPSVALLRAIDVQSSSGGDLADFALIRVPAQTGIRPLALAAPEVALTPVVSTGYPGLQLQTDPVFGRLREGDVTAARQLSPVFGTGVISHLQRYGREGVTLVLHGAEISPGNSGGPLTDYCGRVVGVNTFLRTDASLPVTVRYALGSDGLSAFLRSSGISVPLASGRCDLHGVSATAAASPAGAALPPRDVPSGGVPLPGRPTP